MTRTLYMHKVRAVARRSLGDPNERHGSDVGSQQQRSNSFMDHHEAAGCTQRGRTWLPQERRCRRSRFKGDPTESMGTSVWLYHVFTVHLRFLHCACTDYNHSTAASWRPPRVATAIIALPWRAHGALQCMQGVCRVLTQRSQCVVKCHENAI